MRCGRKSRGEDDRGGKSRSKGKRGCKAGLSTVNKVVDAHIAGILTRRIGGELTSFPPRRYPEQQRRSHYPVVSFPPSTSSPAFFDVGPFR